MGNQKVSVIIPTYNRAYCLPTALESLQGQTYGDWEALVIDDGSTDDSAAVVESLAARDRRIRYVHQENRGVSAARNAGLRIADGEWIAFLDSDDSWDAWKLSAQIACLRQLPEIGMVWTDINAFDSAGTLVSPRHLRKMYSAYGRMGNREIFQHRRPLAEMAPDLECPDDVRSATMVLWGDVYSAMIVGSLVHTSSVVMTKARQRAVGFFNESYRTGEDYDFHLRSCRAGAVALLDVPAVRYRIAGGEDQLTEPGSMLEVALNGLRTQEAAIAHDRDRIDLTDAEIAQLLAATNAWVASELFDRGEFVQGRPHFRRALSRALGNPRMLLKAAICHLPPAWAGSVVAWARRRKAS